jgi:hypothetical protein
MINHSQAKAISVNEQSHSGCADRFIVDKRLVKEIFVDERLSLG